MTKLVEIKSYFDWTSRFSNWFVISLESYKEKARQELLNKEQTLHKEKTDMNYKFTSLEELLAIQEQKNQDLSQKLKQAEEDKEKIQNQPN